MTADVEGEIEASVTHLAVTTNRRTRQPVASATGGYSASLVFRTGGVAESYEQEVLYGRDPRALRVFVSSRMNSNLDAERIATAETIDSVDGHRAWWWERDAPTGVLHSENECVGFAATSDLMVLLIGGELSPIVKAEYGAAEVKGVDRHVFVKRDGTVLPEDVEAFIESQYEHVVSRNFQNVDELRTMVRSSLMMSFVRATRHQEIYRRKLQAKPHE